MDPPVAKFTGALYELLLYDTRKNICSCGTYIVITCDKIRNGICTFAYMLSYARIGRLKYSYIWLGQYVVYGLSARVYCVVR